MNFESEHRAAPSNHTGELRENPCLNISDVAQAFFPYLTLFQADTSLFLIVVSGSRALV